MKMKKSFKVIAVLSMAAVITCACAAGCSAQKKNSVEQNGKSVFPISTMGGDDSVSYSMGDVMPFFDGEVMNIYHLQNSKGSLSMYYHPISRLTTSDYVNYTDRGVSINYEEDPKSVDASIGTGSVIKDSSGTYHFFYTGHNDHGTDKDIGLPSKECVRHATSKDQETWTKVEDFKIYGSSDDFRDPYVYYDADEQIYNMLITTRENGAGVIKRYTAASLDAASSGWKDSGVFFYNDGGNYNMECPSYLEYNGFYYLAYSEQGDNRVTHYRYKTEKDGDWKKFERDSIDASGFYAGRLEKAGDKLYAFAWCANLTGGSTGDFDWGGNLVAHELEQLSDGELCAVMISDVKKVFANEVQYQYTEGGKIESVAFDEGFSAKCAEKLASNVTRISFSFDIGKFGGDFGITFGVDGKYDNRLGTCAVAFDTAGSRLSCYNDISSIVRYGNPLASLAFKYSTNKKYNVDMIIDGEILTVYLDGTVALTARFPDMRRKNFAFYSNGVKVNFEGITFYE